MNLKELCDRTCVVVKEAGAFIRNERKKFSASAIEYKGKNDMVSYVDKQTEEQLVKRFSELLPGSGFIGEEKTNNTEEKEYMWIIDPLDGTTNFIHGLPPYAISVGLQHGNKTVLGVVYEVNLDECFYAFDGGGSFLNNSPIRVSTIATMKDTLVGTGFPYSNFILLSEYMQVFDYCMKNTHGIRRPGSASVDLAYVACGRFDAFYEYGLNPWDVAAGAIIIKEAGGRVSDFSGGNNYLFGREMIATNGHVHEEFLAVIKKNFNKHGSTSSP